MCTYHHEDYQLSNMVDSQITQAVTGSSTIKLMTFILMTQLVLLCGIIFLKIKTGDMMNITSLIVFLAIGGLAGWLAGKIMNHKNLGILGSIIVGVLGAVIGGFAFNLLGLNANAGGILGAIVTAFIGAIMLLYAIKIIKKA